MRTVVKPKSLPKPVVAPPKPVPPALQAPDLNKVYTRLLDAEKNINTISGLINSSGGSDLLNILYCNLSSTNLTYTIPSSNNEETIVIFDISGDPIITHITTYDPYMITTQTVIEIILPSSTKVGKKYSIIKAPKYIQNAPSETIEGATNSYNQVNLRVFGRILGDHNYIYSNSYTTIPNQGNIKLICLDINEPLYILY